jgi:hypothetical protein
MVTRKLASVALLLAFAVVADPTEAEQLKLSPLAPTMAECYALSGENNRYVVGPLQTAVFACHHQPPQWGPGYWDHCPDRNSSRLIPWPQCDDPQRALCEARDAAREQFDLCRRRAEQRAEADKAEAAAQKRLEEDTRLAGQLKAYAEAADRLGSLLYVLRSPERFVKQTMPAMASRRFTSVMDDWFGPDGQIESGKSEAVEEYYDLALSPLKAAQRLAIRDPFVRFIQDSALDKLQKNANAVGAAIEHAALDMAELDESIPARAAKTSSFRPSAPAPQAARASGAPAKPAECALLTNMASSRQIMMQNPAKWQKLLQICGG